MDVNDFSKLSCSQTTLSQFSFAPFYETKQNLFLILSTRQVITPELNIFPRKCDGEVILEAKIIKLPEFH